MAPSFSRLQSPTVIRTFSPFNTQVRVAESPLFQHVMIISVLLGSNAVPFFRAPADLVQSNERVMGNTQFNKSLDRLLAPFEGRGIDLIERNLFVSLKEQRRLTSAKIIQISIHTASLNNVL